MNSCNCSIDELNDRYKYDSVTGIITNRISSGRAKKGEEAGTKNAAGYRVVSISSSRYYGHRVSWFMYYGAWPKSTIDHINGVRDDNRIVNLRDVDHKENLKNQRLQKSNTSGVVGVYWNKPTKNWRVKIEVNGKQIHIGYFQYMPDAVKARQKAEVKYGFHENHGRHGNG